MRTSPVFPCHYSLLFENLRQSKSKLMTRIAETGIRKRGNIHYKIDDSSSATRKTRKTFMLSKMWRSMTMRAELTDIDMRRNSFSVWKMSDEILKKFPLPLYTQSCGFSNWIVTKQSQCEATWRRTKTSEITSLPWNLCKTFLTRPATSCLTCVNQFSITTAFPSPHHSIFAYAKVPALSSSEQRSVRGNHKLF